MKKTGSVGRIPSGIIHHLINPQRRAKEKVTAVFEFNPRGRLTGVFVNSENDQDQLVLERGIERLVRPSHFSWVKRLFR